MEDAVEENVPNHDGSCVGRGGLEGRESEGKGGGRVGEGADLCGEGVRVELVAVLTVFTVCSTMGRGRGPLKAGGEGEMGGRREGGG